MKTQCPECYKKFSVPLEFVGKPVKCPYCESSVKAILVTGIALSKMLLIVTICATVVGVLGFCAGILTTRSTRAEREQIKVEYENKLSKLKRGHQATIISWEKKL